VNDETMSTETLQFKTELKQLLHLIVHSLYSHKDIFLRELISNASDAIDTVRFESLTRAELQEDNTDWKIKIIADEAAGTLTISDNGIGMSRQTIVENLGTIARSGARAFLESLKQADVKERPELIGQFGVGFYSAFMVADKVTVISRMAGNPADGVKWESDGQGEFTVEQVDKTTRGTNVILHLKVEDKEYLRPYRIHQIVKKYSDFVEHPIVMDMEKEAGKKETVVEETLNSRKAIWLRPKSQIAEQEYNDFYKHLTHDVRDPARTVHYSAEGAIEFRALLYLPAHVPYQLLWGDTKKGLHLYIQRVFIMDDCEALLPPYLRFVRGVVDSPDLPLNVSREILQQSAPLEKIKSNLVNKVLKSLEEMKRTEYDAYVKFYEELSAFLKEGVNQDWTNREALADLLLFGSNKTEPGRYTSLADYVTRMPGEQTEIFYLAGESRDLLLQSPYLEGFQAKGWEVLLLTEPIDEFVVQALPDYKGKKLRAADKAGPEPAELSEDKKRGLQPLLDLFKEKLSEIKEARPSRRLKDSAVCLVAEEGAMSAHMERLLERMNKHQQLPPTQRILEVNPDHPVIDAMQKMLGRDAKDTRLEAYCRILYDQAVLAEGSKVKDPVAFARRINELLVKDAQ
jgi:molecular chaperone HtpG